MSSLVRPFEFKGSSIRTITYENGVTWFLAKDVCDVLDIRTDTIRTILDQDEVATTNPDSIGVAQNGGRDPLIVSEPGLYGLIFKSRKPEAEEFKRWIKHEVLPSLRQHGGYMVGQESMNPEQMVLASMRWLESKVKEQEAALAVMAPKAAALDDFTDTKSSYSVNEAAKLLANTGVEIGQQSLFERLRDLGWVFRRESHWVASQSRIDQGHLMMRAYKGFGAKSDGSRFDFAPQVRITRKGLTLLHQRLTAQDFNRQLEGASNV